MYLQCSQSFTKMDQIWHIYRTPWGHSKSSNLAHFGFIILVRFEFYWLGHCNCTAWNIERKTMNEPLGKISGTFFGKIHSVPMVYLMGTPQSHDLEHCKSTGHFPAGGTPRKLVGGILNVLPV